MKRKVVAVLFSTAIVLIIIQIVRMFSREKLKSLLAGGDQGARNVKAFLKMIRYAEGTAGTRGYNTLFGYEYFENFASHPNRRVCKSGYCSTAAGAYQILYKTWTTVILPRVSLPDFSPESQDLAAVVLLKYRNAYDDILAGRFASAVQKAGLEWASLPGSPYGQPVRTIAQVRSVYEQEGGVVA